MWSFRGYPALSLYLPLETPRAAKERLAELAKLAAVASGEPGLTARAMVQDAQAALSETLGQVDAGTFVFLSGHGSQLRLLLPLRLTPLATLGTRIHLRPLLCATDSLQPQTVVSLAEDALRIYQGHPNRLRMVHSAVAVPTARSRSRRLALSRLDRELRRMHAADGPIVLCADPSHARVFERHSAFGASLSLNLAALHSVPPLAVQRELREPLSGAVLARRKRRLASFPRLLRAGLLRTGVRDILSAARAGMVETLLLTRQTDTGCCQDERHDRLNLAAIQTLASRGNVLCVEEGMAPATAAAVAFVRFGWA